MHMQHVLSHNLKQRQTLIQKLGLESRAFKSCLVRSEMLLKTSEFQAPLRLVRKVLDEDNYRSVQDFLVAVFVPLMRPWIQAYYRGESVQMIRGAAWAEIDRLDRTLVTALHGLRVLYTDLRSAAWREGREFTATEVTETWLDFVARPCFEAPRILKAA